MDVTSILIKLNLPSLLDKFPMKALAGNVGNMLATCWRHVEMSMNLGIFACECQHQNSSDTRYLCQKLPTLWHLLCVASLFSDFTLSKSSCFRSNVLKTTAKLLKTI